MFGIIALGGGGQQVSSNWGSQMGLTPTWRGTPTFESKFKKLEKLEKSVPPELGV